MSFGSSGNGLYLEALQGSQPLIVGEHPWVTPIVSDSSDNVIYLYAYVIFHIWIS